MSQATEGIAQLGAGSPLSNPYSVTAAAALTCTGVTFTWTSNDPGVTDGTATIDDGSTVGDDNDAGAALSALEDQFGKLLADVTALHTRVGEIQTALDAMTITT